MQPSEQAVRRYIDAWFGAGFRFGSLGTFADGSPPFVGEDAGEVDDDGRIAVIYAFAGRLPEA
jgi:hypothetical protein